MYLDEVSSFSGEHYTPVLPDAYKVFLKVGADAEVQKLRRQIAHGSKMKHVPALYLATAMALEGMTKQELEALKLRIEKKRVMSGSLRGLAGCSGPQGGIMKA